MSARGDARAARRQRYWTGKPCKNGHIADRYTSSGGCVRCLEMAHDTYSAQRARIAGGYKLLKLVVHPDDVETVRGFADALRLAR